MNALLLDTHVWIWYAEGVPGVLPKKIVVEIERAMREDRLHISVVSVWEIGLLIAKNRVVLSAPVKAWVRSATAIPGFRLHPLHADVALESTLLPGKLHGDPADRLLIAQARLGRYTLVTRDQKIIDYSKHGHVSVLTT